MKVCAGVCKCFADSGAKRKDCRCQNGAKKVPKATKSEPNKCHNEARVLQKYYLSNKNGTSYECITLKKLIKKPQGMNGN